MEFPETPHRSLPFERLYWVIPDMLLAGPYPGALNPAEATQKLRGLVGCGIRHVVDLMEEDERNAQGLPFAPYIEELRAIARESRTIAKESGEEVGWSRHPIHDLSVPSREEMRAILDEIDAVVATGRPVYVHCWGGIGRTGTVVGCYLARHGIATGQAALEEILQLRQRTLPRRVVPETAEQHALVRSWQRGE